jgi:hypothetical protein
LILEVAVLGCTPTEPNQLDQLGTVRVTIKGQPFELWVADEFDEQQRGLMFVNAEQLAPLSDGTRRGMIFVFDHEQKLSFWMRNTIIPLDIAYVDSEGRVVATYTMVPLDDRLGQYQSRDPARIAIEVSAGVWRDLGLIAGDQVDIPANLLKR